MKTVRLETSSSPAAGASPVCSLVASLIGEAKPKAKAKGEYKPRPFVPQTILSVLPAPVFQHVKQDGKVVYKEADGFVALASWAAYEDDDGNQYPATLRLLKLKTANHLSKVADLETGKTKPYGVMTVTREDLALFSNMFDKLVEKAKELGTLKK